MPYTVIINSGELYHHGILGMKWGHRQGPPYPLDSGDHSSSEKRAGWRKSLSVVQKVAKTAKSVNEDLERGKQGPGTNKPPKGAIVDGPRNSAPPKDAMVDGPNSRKSLSDRMSEREMKAHEVAIEKSRLKLKTEQGRKADELYSKANAITERKDFDPRNAETKAKYDRLIKEADRLNKEAEELVKAEMDKKYGEKYLKDLERARSRDSALIVAGSLAAIPLLPIIIPTALIAASIKSKKANKNGRA